MFIELNRGESFKGLANYCLHDVGSDTSERVDFVQTRNLATDNPEAAWRVMAARTYIQDELKAQNGVGPQGRKGKPVGHMLISWGRDEADAQSLDEDKMARAVDGALKAIGAEDRQAMIIAHNDTAETSPHCHVIINLIGDDGRLLKNYNERKKLSRFALEEEKRVHGKAIIAEREKRWQDRDAGETPAPMKKKARHLYEMEKAAEQDNDKATAAKALLARQKELERAKEAQAERQSRNRERLKEIAVERERRIKAQHEALIRRAKSNARNEFADPRRELNSKHQQQLDDFDAKEKGIRGSLQNGLALFDWKMFFNLESGKRSTGLKDLFQMITSEQARRDALLKKQQEERVAMRLEQRKAEQAAERLAEAFQRKRLDEAQAGYARKAEAMKERQQRSEAALKEQQKTITAERNAVLKQYREQLQEQKRQQVIKRKAEQERKRQIEEARKRAEEEGEGKQEGGDQSGATTLTIKTRKPRRERKPRDPSTSRRKRDIEKRQAEELQRRQQQEADDREAKKAEQSYEDRMMEMMKRRREEERSKDLDHDR